MVLRCVLLFFGEHQGQFENMGIRDFLEKHRKKVKGEIVVSQMIKARNMPSRDANKCKRCVYVCVCVCFVVVNICMSVNIRDENLLIFVCVYV